MLVGQSLAEALAAAGYPASSASEVALHNTDIEFELEWDFENQRWCIFQ